MFRQFSHVIQALGKIKLPLLIPVLRPLIFLILITAVLFPTDTMKRFAESSILGIFVTGGLLLALIIASVTTIQKANELLWLQDHKDKSILYLRILPVYKIELWLAKVTLTMATHLIAIIGVTLAIFFGLPFLFNLLDNSWTHWGLTWWQYQSTSTMGIFAGFGVVMFIIVFYTLGLLSSGAYVPVARRGGKEYNKILISNQYIKTDIIMSVSFLMFFSLAAYFYLTSTPLVYLIVFCVELLFIQYLCSYLVFSGVNSTPSRLSSTLGVGLLLGLVATGIVTSLLYKNLTSEDFLLRNGSYFLIRPIGIERFSNNIFSKLENLNNEEDDALAAYYMGLFLIDKHAVAGAKIKFLTVVNDPNCVKRRMAQDLMTLETTRDNRLTSLIVDTGNNAALSLGDKKQCHRSPKEVAEFLFHTTSIDRQVTFVTQALQSTEREQRMVAAYLAAKLPVTDEQNLSYFRQEIMRLTDGICYEPANKEQWQQELIAYNHALAQLILNTPFILDFTPQKYNTENYCPLIKDQALSHWKAAIKAHLSENTSYTKRFKQKLFNNTTKISADIENISMITEKEFQKLLSLIDWENQLPQIKCHLAQQWKLVQGTPNLNYTYFWINWPRAFFGSSMFKPHFSDNDCKTVIY